LPLLAAACRCCRCHRRCWCAERLKKAEEDATKIVDAARSQRAATLKKARAEAEAEIKQYKEQLEGKLADYKKTLTSDSAKLSKMQSDSDAAIKRLQADVAANSGAIVDRLLTVTTTVNLKVPEARKGVKSK
jgi:uncharacterized protein YPO0396